MIRSHLRSGVVVACLLLLVLGSSGCAARGGGAVNGVYTGASVGGGP